MSSIFLNHFSTLVFETGSLTECGAYRLVQKTGPYSPDTHLSLLPQCWDFWNLLLHLMFYVSTGIQIQVPFPSDSFPHFPSFTYLLLEELLVIP